MKRLFTVFFLLAAILPARASWYWPFGSDDEVERPRLSVLMEKSSLLIDEASDLAADGKRKEAVEKYREVIAELDRIERENPDRVKSPEFATVRNKRAYVNAAIDTLQLAQAQANARPVAVSDTRALEKKFAAEVAKRKPLSKRDQAIKDMTAKDYEAAKVVVAEMLDENPDDPVALNLQSALYVRLGDLRSAEAALDRAIERNPRDWHAYYNMSDLILRTGPSAKKIARRYYETGRTMGGPVDKALEEALR